MAENAVLGRIRKWTESEEKRDATLSEEEAWGFKVLTFAHCFSAASTVADWTARPRSTSGRLLPCSPIKGSKDHTFV